jgi:hypothetical protein
MRIILLKSSQAPIRFRLFEIKGNNLNHLGAEDNLGSIVKIIEELDYPKVLFKKTKIPKNIRAKLNGSLIELSPDEIKRYKKYFK